MLNLLLISKAQAVTKDGQNLLHQLVSDYIDRRGRKVLIWRHESSPVGSARTRALLLEGREGGRIDSPDSVCHGFNDTRSVDGLKINLAGVRQLEAKALGHDSQPVACRAGTFRRREIEASERDLCDASRGGGSRWLIGTSGGGCEREQGNESSRSDRGLRTD
jgi:hypothetical protein